MSTIKGGGIRALQVLNGVSPIGDTAATDPGVTAADREQRIGRMAALKAAVALAAAQATVPSSSAVLTVAEQFAQWILQPTDAPNAD